MMAPRSAFLYARGYMLALSEHHLALGLATNFHRIIAVVRDPTTQASVTKASTKIAMREKTYKPNWKEKTFYCMNNTNR